MNTDEGMMMVWICVEEYWIGFDWKSYEDGFNKFVELVV